MFVRVLSATVFVLATTTAVASQVHYEETELRELIDRSELIVIARVLDPMHTILEVPITPRGRAPDPEKHPPFRAVVSHFGLVEILYSDRKVELPAKLSIVSPLVGSQFDLHRRYYLEGLSKSPIYQRYEAKGDPMRLEPGAEVILFLRHDSPARSSGVEARLWKSLDKAGAGFVYVVDGAMERPSMKREISALAAARPR